MLFRSDNTSISTVPGFHSPIDDSFNEPSLSPLSKALAFSSSNIDWIAEDLGEGNPCKSEVARKENLLLDDTRSILISLSTRCVWKRRICGSFQVYRIKYYGNFDRPLEQYLRENLFDQVCFFIFLFFFDKKSRVTPLLSLTMNGYRDRVSFIIIFF